MEIEPNNVSRPSNDFAGRFSEEPFSPGRPKADRGNHRWHGGADRVGLNRTAGSGDRRNSARASDPGHGVFVGAPPSSANQDRRAHKNSVPRIASPSGITTKEFLW